MDDNPKDPEEWFTKGDQLPTPEERLKYYQAGLSLPRIFRSYAWRGIGNARQDLGEVSKAEFAYEKAADAAIVVAEKQSGSEDIKEEIEFYPEENGYHIVTPNPEKLLINKDSSDIGGILKQKEWFAKGELLLTPAERLKYYKSGLTLPQIFHSLAWKGIGEAREDMGDITGADEAFDNAAEAAVASREEVENTSGNMRVIGKCPKCDADLTDVDIADIEFRGFAHRHSAYVCRKCRYIIGFSATR